MIMQQIDHVTASQSRYCL